MGVTNFGTFVRKLRIKHCEILKDMADKLDVSSAFLSAVENGKKYPPQKWYDVLVKKYKLNITEKEDLKKAMATSNNKITINTKGMPDKNKELAMIFARSFGKINDDTMQKIKKLLEKGR